MSRMKIDDKTMAFLRLLARRVRLVTEGPAAFAVLMQRGYALRVGMTHASITDTGRAFLEGVDHVMRAL